MELIAHRAGNLPGTVAAALAVADAIELDVHAFRGRLEVRHAKVLWPSSVRWERWELIPNDHPRPTLDEIVRHVPEGAHLWLDLKGFGRRLTRRVLAVTGDRFVLTVSSRAWWILAPARRAGGVRTMRSVGNRAQRWIVSRRPLGDGLHGVVMHERLATGDALRRLRRGTAPVIVWAVEDLERVVELAGIGVDGFIADDLALIAAARAAGAGQA